jgi:RimJ/RimL family protein N-acetyltransferase
MIEIRRARPDDVDFLVALTTHEDVEPFLSARRATSRGELLEEIERSSAGPDDFGRFVIEVDGERAGAMGFAVSNKRSRVARLGGLAIHPDFRGGRISDEAARLFQRHLVHELGYHRLELEIYGFNERAMRHAERSGFIREGVKRKAYRRRGEWVDGVLYGLIEDDLAGEHGALEPLEEEQRGEEEVRHRREEEREEAERHDAG